MARVRVRKGQSEKENADSFVCKYVCLCVHSEYDEHSIECEDFRCGFSLYMYIFVFFPVIYEEHSTNEDDKPLILSAARTITLSFFYLFVRAGHRLVCVRAFVALPPNADLITRPITKCIVIWLHPKQCPTNRPTLKYD